MARILIDRHVGMLARRNTCPFSHIEKNLFKHAEFKKKATIPRAHICR